MCRLSRPSLRRAAPLLVLPLVASLLVLAAPSASAAPVEDYASYQGQDHCVRHAKPGTRRLSAGVVRHYGGRRGPVMRRCRVGGQSEHKEGRAFDWTLDATRAADRRRARRFLAGIFETRGGEAHARARRMGVMYIIWNDRIWRSYRQFEQDSYLAASCRSRRRCSKTARHRDHMHVSLGWRGANARTSWFRRFQ